MLRIARAPASSANLGPGFDVLALALDAAERFTEMDEAERQAASVGVGSEPHIFPMPAG